MSYIMWQKANKQTNKMFLYVSFSFWHQLEARLLIFNQLSYRQTNIMISTKANQDQLREGGRLQRR